MSDRALVVGASAGIGRAAALRLAELDFDLAIVGRRRDRLDEVAERTGRAHPLVADLSDPEQCAPIVERAAGALGGLDLIVHAASASRLLMLSTAGAGEWAQIFQTNVIAPALVVRAALGHLSDHAVVALLSSESVGQPFPGLVPYATSKAALEELTRGWRIEHPELRFCSLRVGATDGTEFARDFHPELGAELLPRWIASGRMPAQMMQAAELGRMIADTLAAAVRSPGVDVQDLVIRAPGGSYTGDIGFILDNVEAASGGARAERGVCLSLAPSGPMGRGRHPAGSRVRGGDWCRRPGHPSSARPGERGSSGRRTPVVR